MKRFIMLLFCACLLFHTFPSVSAADIAATVNAAPYTSIEAALQAAAENSAPDTVTLLRDASLSSSAAVAAGDSLSLSGHSLSLSAQLSISGALELDGGRVTGDTLLVAESASSINGFVFDARTVMPSVVCSAAEESTCSLKLEEDIRLLYDTPAAGWTELRASWHYLDDSGASVRVNGVMPVMHGTNARIAVELSAKSMTDAVSMYCWGPDADGTQTAMFFPRQSVVSLCAPYLSGGDEALQLASAAMLLYGSAAQEYFDYKTDALAGAGLSDALRNAVNNIGIADILPDKSATYTGNAYIGTSCVLTGVIDLRFYFSRTGAGEYTFTVDGAAAVPYMVGDTFYSVSVPVSVTDYKKAFTVAAFSGGEQIASASDSVCDYLQRAPKQAELAGISSSLLRYAFSANRYFAVPTGIRLSLDSVKILPNKTYQLIAAVTPADAAGKITWFSSDENIATVDDNGLVTGVSAGTATVTATCGAVSADCKIRVISSGGSTTPPIPIS